MDRDDIGFFDRSGPWSVVERAVPHWIQSGTACFVTWRLGDSLPKDVLSRLDFEIAELRRNHRADPSGSDVRNSARGEANQQAQLQWKLFAIRDKYLDQGHGSCRLADLEVSALVLDSLKRFDEQRYFLTDAVVMPNHVHYLAAFADEQQFLKQNTDWKRFTGREINRYSNRRGDVWQSDQFDRLVRSPEHFESYRRYIAENPKKAGLKPGQFRHYQKEL